MRSTQIQVLPSGYVIRHSAHQKSPLPMTRITVFPGETTQRSSAPTTRVSSVLGVPPG